MTWHGWTMVGSVPRARHWDTVFLGSLEILEILENLENPGESGESKHLGH